MSFSYEATQSGKCKINKQDWWSLKKQRVYGEETGGSLSSAIYIQSL